MRRNGTGNETAEFEHALAERQDEHYVLRLYVTGLTRHSTEAVASLRALCEEYLAGRYDLEVIDLYQLPELAQSEQLIAVPTLIKELPLPVRRLIGNLSDTQRVLVGLGLCERTGSLFTRQDSEGAW